MGISTRAIDVATGVHKDTVRNVLAGGEFSPTDVMKKRSAVPA
jgi:hypothetical protein